YLFIKQIKVFLYDNKKNKFIKYEFSIKYNFFIFLILMFVDPHFLFISHPSSKSITEIISSINELKMNIMKNEYVRKEDIKIYKLPPPTIILPKAFKTKVKEKTRWQKFAERKNIKKKKKIYDQNVDEYLHNCKKGWNKYKSGIEKVEISIKSRNNKKIVKKMLTKQL
ncbi:Ribosome biogenesis regulatory protein, partial [Spraguea lophii 42_110]